MRGLNIQRIVVEKEENEKLYEALEILKEFRNTLGCTIADNVLGIVEELNDLNDDIDEITNKLSDFLDDLGFCDYIEIEGQRKLTFARAVSHFAQKLASNFVQVSRLTFPFPHVIINSTSKERLIKPNPKPWTVHKEVKVQKG